jgi:hypothetical protein
MRRFEPGETVKFKFFSEVTIQITFKDEMYEMCKYFNVVQGHISDISTYEKYGILGDKYRYMHILPNLKFKRTISGLVLS